MSARQVTALKRQANKAAMRIFALIPALALLTLAACDRGDPSLFNLRKQDQTPDEFAILPNLPLEQPENLSVLPPPTPGGSNLTDPRPNAQAVAALGGNINRGTGVDQALVNSVGRYGVAGNIRETLAREDLEWRRANNGRILERVFNVNVYFDAYRRQALDQTRELQRLRRAGVRTVAAPPEPE
jgi:hypothetical protein